jgi:PPOX class probable F420-dependent enzyme
MPDRSTASDRRRWTEAAEERYFAPLAQGRYFLLTMSRPKGAPVSAHVPGIADGGRAYIRVWDRSVAGRYLRHAGQVQVTACGVLGLVSSGPPRYAGVRPLAGEEADRAAARLARKYSPRPGFLPRLRHRTQVYYQLLPP